MYPAFKSRYPFHGFTSLSLHVCFGLVWFFSIRVLDYEGEKFRTKFSYL